MSMAAGVPTMPRGRAFTRTDLEAMPDDGNRYELIDGVLIVTPSPVTRHQWMSMALSVRLYNACTPDLAVLSAPFDVVLDQGTVVQPDVLVARRRDLTERNLPTAPVLSAEVLSSSTGALDLLLKKERMQRAGCPHYWILDPDEVTVTAWELVDGAYCEIARVAGDEILTVSSPFEIALTPAELLE